MLFAAKLGSFILIIVGCWIFISAYIDQVKSKTNKFYSSENDLLLSLKIKPLGLIIHVLREPARVDFDSSGTINIAEAFVLGLALALDAVGVGLGAGLSNYSIYALPVIIGIMNIIFVLAGFLIGKKMNGTNLPAGTSEYLPGIIIILLGIINLI